MVAYVLRSLAQAVVVMLAVALIAFAMFRYVGDPVASMVGQEASVADRAALAERLGLNDSGPGAVRPLRARHRARRFRDLVPARPAGGGPRSPSDCRRPSSSPSSPSALALIVGDRARRLYGDQPSRRRRQSPDDVFAGRREPADVPDRHRPHLRVRGRAALAAVVRTRRRRPRSAGGRPGFSPTAGASR